jgi:ATP-dependent RNA helicase RhlE
LLTFSDLNINTPLFNALTDMGLQHPTIIQHRAFPVVMAGRNVVGIAQTGTGKTIAYLLPILRQLEFSKKNDPRVLILVPTRELVVQVVGELEKLTKYMDVRVGGVYGGTNMNTQKVIVTDGLDILVATPGRLLDLAVGGFLRLKAVQKLVIDEVDEMMDLGFKTQLTNIFDILPERRQNLLFSATITPEVEELIAQSFDNPAKIEAAPMGTPLDKIEQRLYRLPNFNSKINLLEHLLNEDATMTKVLVFADSKRQADLLFDSMDELFPNGVGIIHSNKSQNYRFGSLRAFASGQSRILIATDLVARGLDITDVSHVVCFDIPQEAADFIHRIGRTGRADKNGVAIIFATVKEEEALNQVQALMQRDIPVLPIPNGVPMSEVLIEDEKPYIPGIRYTQTDVLKTSQGAFHEKSAKNSKVNLGGSYKRTIKLKFKKPLTRGAKKK